MAKVAQKQSTTYGEDDEEESLEIAEDGQDVLFGSVLTKEIDVFKNKYKSKKRFLPNDNEALKYNAKKIKLNQFCAKYR